MVCGKCHSMRCVTLVLHVMCGMWHGLWSVAWHGMLFVAFSVAYDVWH